MRQKNLTIILTTLLSMLILAWAGGCSHETKSNDNEDPLEKGWKLFLKQSFEEAYGSFRLAWLLAETCDYNPYRALKASKGMADCAFYIGAVDTCVYRYNKALVWARKLNETLEEYDIYKNLRQAYMSKADMKNVMLIEQKIDSLMSNTDNKKICMDMQQRLAMEALQQQNPKLAEHYLLANETLLDSLSASERQSMEYTVYWYLRNFYFGQQDNEKTKKYSKLYIESVKRGFKQSQIAYMAYDTEAILRAMQKDRIAAFNALDSMEYGLELEGRNNISNIMHYHEVKGRVHTMFGEWEEACNEFKKALKAVEGTNIVGRTSYYQVGRLWGDALCQLKKYDEALDAYSICWEYCKYQYGEGSVACTDVLIAIANLEKLCGKTEIGKKCCIKAIDNCKRIVNEQFRYISIQDRNAFWNVFAPCMFNMPAYALNLGETQSLFTEKCYEALLFSKNLLLESDRTMAAAVQLECTPEEKNIYYEMQGLQNQLKALMNDYEKNKERIEDLHERISKQNQRLTPIISKLNYTDFLSIGYEDVKRSLKDNEVLLDFTDYLSDDGKQQLAAFIVDRKQNHPKLIKSFSEEKVNQVLAGRKMYYLYMKPYASQAIKLIWEPLSKEVKDKKAIYYVPSGILHSIALESLPLSDGSLLGEHYDFIRLTSAREIVKSRKNEPISNYTTATLYGALKYDMDTTSMAQEALRYKVEPLIAFNRGETVTGDKRWTDLPSTKEEIDKINTILKNRHLTVSVQIGTKGTEESFLSLSGKAPRIIHIATHGFYYNSPKDAEDISYLKGYNDAMQFSGLIMAGGNRAWTGQKIPNGTLSGVLTANDIARMDLRGTDLVVLSACKTGLGIATPEGVFGLQRAFKKAGVQTLIVALWNVDDEATKDFMVKFYEELADVRNNWNKRVAFEKAKNHIRSIERYKEPFFWAGFVMLD